MRRLRRAGVVVGVSAMTLGGEAQAAEPDVSRMDAALRRELARPAALATPTISMFVKSSDVARTVEEVRAAGGSVGTIAGDVLTVRLPRAGIAAISRSTAIRHLEGARPVQRRLDRLIPETKVDQIHGGAGGLPGPFKGKNVVVGVIDEGIDVGHEAFKKPGGGSRVLSVWDQTLTMGGTPPAGFTYGITCDNAQLAGGTCPHASTGMHGTHVAGIAAAGPVAGSPYVGVAPEADIVFVHLGSAPNKTGNEATTTAICDGASYIFKAAEAAGKPAVINMSLGEHSGPHDGSSLADQCLDNLTGPGKIIVAAAGNEGRGSVSVAAGNPRVFLHATGTASATPQVFKHLPGGTAAATSEIYIWWDTPGDISVRLGVENAGGDVYTAAVTSTKPLAAVALTVGADTLGRVEASNGTLASGGRMINLTLGDENKDKKELEYTWLLEITGTGKFDAFIDTTSTTGFLQSAVPAGATVDNAMSIGFPAIASKVIAVGSYVSRNEWTPFDADAGVQKQLDPVTGTQVTVGALSGFSSRGPARKTTLTGNKPDITAPGEIIVSTLHEKHKLDEATKLMKPSPNGYALSEGTSMATPAVAGIVALMLQTSAGARSTKRGSCRTSSTTLRSSSGSRRGGDGRGGRGPGTGARCR